MKKVIRLSESDLQKMIKRIISENSALDNTNNYYNTRTLQILKYPEKIPTISGYDQKIVDVVSKGMYDVIDGIGMGSESKEKLKYLISKGFTTLPNSIEICKRYKKLSEENLFDALDGEWMAGNSLDTIKMMMVKSMSNYCNTSKNAPICKIKSAEELKYGI